jgi:ABC-2 type transport system ATP-binding protein
MGQAEALCDRVVMIHQGKKVLDNTLQEIHARYTPREIVVEPLGAIDERVLSREIAERGITGVVSVRQSQINPQSSQRYRVTFDHQSNPGALLQAIAASTACSRIELVRPTLEDVFIEIVAGSAKTQEEREEMLAMMRAGGRTDSSSD